MRPVTLNIGNVAGALDEIQRASHEADTTEIAQNFKVDVENFPQTFVINVTTPSVENVALVLATFIQILQKGGLNRTT
jgi:hypothetical protein